MWELDHKEGRAFSVLMLSALKNWCLQIVLEKALESPLVSKEIKPVNPKGNQHWIFIGRTDAEAEAPKLWPPDEKSWLIGKDSSWERWKARREGNDRGWDGWMASLTLWTWVWANSRRQWRTGKPGMLQSMGSQRVEHDLATEQNPNLQQKTQLNDPESSSIWRFWFSAHPTLKVLRQGEKNTNRRENEGCWQIWQLTFEIISRFELADALLK